jgi:tetratricopeptide (TPR) repeat protein
MIREVDPPRPSTRLSSLGTDAKEVAKKRQTQIDDLTKQLRSELEWIPLKAMRKDRSQRYGTASELAGDVRNYLQGRALLAGPESHSYRVRKFLRRNRGPVVAVATVLLTLVLGIAATTVALIGQTRARAEAELGRQQAVQSKAESDAVLQFQLDMLTSADPYRLLGDKVTVLQAISTAVQQLDSRSMRDRPLVEASVREAIGSTFRALGRSEDARQNLVIALELRRSHRPPGHPDIATSLEMLGLAVQDEAKVASAEALLREALEIRRKSLRPQHPDIARSLNNLARLLQHQGKLAEAETYYQESLEILRKDHPDGNPNIGTGLNNLATVLRAQGRFIEAEPLAREALQVNRKTLPVGHPNLAISLNTLAASLRDQERLAEAEPLHREALETLQKALPAGHPDLAFGLHHLALLLQAQRRFSEAEALHREALEIRRNAFPADHPHIAWSMDYLGVVLHDEGKFAEAEQLLRTALEVRRKSLPDGHPHLATTLNDLGLLLRDQGNFPEAESLCREALDMRQTRLGPENWQVSSDSEQVGHILALQNKLTEAEAMLLRGHEGLMSANAPRRRQRESIEHLMQLYEVWNKPNQAAEWRAKLAEFDREHPPTTTPSVQPATQAVEQR